MSKENGLLQSAKSARSKSENTIDVQSERATRAPLVAKLTTSSRGSWYQAPHVCIPALSEQGPLIILIELNGWQRALTAAGGNITDATLTTLRRAQETGNWIPNYGERTILVK